jgi:hypothetical protein
MIDGPTDLFGLPPSQREGACSWARMFFLPEMGQAGLHDSKHAADDALACLLTVCACSSHWFICTCCLLTIACLHSLKRWLLAK